ncbi:MAG TPA: NAD-dependent epimerase/dehydratase family protein [Chloroflexota bacterium]
MRVMVTGGTGFVGSHTVAELARAGHGVRLLVRSAARVRPALAPLGVEGVDGVVEGDVTDPEAVERALDGCDAVVHCASVYSLDPRATAAIRRTNVRAAEVVLGAACGRGLDPVVHVSSHVALLGAIGAVLTPDSPPTFPPGAYARSKADSDRVARRFQEAGAPVVITYPGAVVGPHDPHFGESCQTIRNVLRGLLPLAVDGSLPITDVRDLAKLHVAVLERGRGPRRYMATARDLTTREMFELAARLTGRGLSTIVLPAWALLPLVRLVDALQVILPFRLPFNAQMVYTISRRPRLDDSLTRQTFGLHPRDLEATIVDTVRWMVEVGRLPRYLAGKLV